MGGISVFILLSILMSVFFVFLIIAIIIGIYMLINYIFESIFLHTIAKENHYKYPITSWIPFYNKCILGRIADKKGLGIALSIIEIFSLILIIISYRITTLPGVMNTIIFLLIILLLILSFIFNLVLSHSIMKKVTLKFADFLTILNVLTLGFSRSIILFIMRNRKELR